MKSTTILALSNGIYTAILIDARPDALPNYVVFDKTHRVAVLARNRMGGVLP